MGILLAGPAPAQASSGAPTEADIEVVRHQLFQAKRVLANPLGPWNDGERQELQASVQRAEECLAHYVALAERGRMRERASRPIYLAGVAIMANDVSGAGVADDLLLPLLGLGLMATHLLTQPPVAPPQLEQVWQTVVHWMKKVGERAAQVRSRIVRDSVDPRPPRPSRKDRDTAIKILTQYERLAAKLGIKLPAQRILELDRLRDLGEITLHHLPATLRVSFPLPAELTLGAIRILCEA